MIDRKSGDFHYELTLGDNMNELIKTVIFAATGGVLLLLGWAALPRPAVNDTADMVGEVLFPKCKPENAVALEIVTFDEQKNRKQEFKIERVNERWSLPSHSNYPADAKSQFFSAASSLTNLKVLRQAGDDADKHVEYGVLDPSEDAAKLLQKMGKTADGAAKSAAANKRQVGKLVVFRDRSKNPLANIIIGNRVESAKAGGEVSKQTYYVRVQNEAPVYEVNLKSDQFSTKFSDWIEKDLLKIDTQQVESVEIRDYTYSLIERINQGLPPEYSPRSLIQVAQAGSPAEWALKKLIEYTDGKPTEVSLAADEELNKAKLDGLKTALDDLKIIDVRRKPPSLVDSLKQKEGTVRSREEMLQLAQAGFYLMPDEQDRPELFSKDGEVRCQTKDGVEYILRFGESRPETPEEAAVSDVTLGKLGPNQSPRRIRYIMVSTRFNPEVIAKPELTPLPQLPGKTEPEKTPDPAKTETGKSETGKAEPGKTEAGKADSGNTEAPATGKEAAKQPEATKQPEAAKQSEPAQQSEPAKAAPAKISATPPQGNAARMIPVNFQVPAKEAPKAAAGKEPVKTEPVPAAKAETPAANNADPAATPATTAPPSAPFPITIPALTAPPAPPQVDEGELEFIRKQSEAENKKKQAAYAKALLDGERTSKLLNDRFSEWYYLISDDEYQKIHLVKNDIIQKKSAAGNAAGGIPGLPGGFQPPPGFDPAILEQIRKQTEGK